MSRLCQDCRFWAAALSVYGLKMVEGFGECRRRAPVGPVNYGISRGKVREVGIISAFPPTAKDDWCGEFEETPSDPG